MSHTTHYVCQEQLEKHGGKATCCFCANHKCIAASYSTHDPKDSYDYSLGYNTALNDVLSMLPHDAPERWRMRIEGIRKV